MMIQGAAKNRSIFSGPFRDRTSERGGVGLLGSLHEVMVTLSVAMEQWSAEQRKFVIEAYFKRGDCYSTAVPCILLIR